MTFTDIFKSNFLENVSNVSLLDIALAIFLSFAIGLMIFVVYKKTFCGVMFSSSFGLLLITLPMITTFVILAVTSNIVLSLGMVGALSIVRFRTAIKEPLDIAYLFWAIAVGIVLAAGLIVLAVFGSVFIAIIMLIFSNKNLHDSPYIIVINCNSSVSEEELQNFISKNVKKSVIKSKSVSKDNIELNYEVRLKDKDTGFVNDLYQIENVENVILVSYNGDYIG